jgi:hypothetical protein
LTSVLNACGVSMFLSVAFRLLSMTIRSYILCVVGLNLNSELIQINRTAQWLSSLSNSALATILLDPCNCKHPVAVRMLWNFNFIHSHKINYPVAMAITYEINIVWLDLGQGHGLRMFITTCTLQVGSSSK